MSNRSIRLNVQLLLWMMQVLMMVRLNRNSCSSLYPAGVAAGDGNMAAVAQGLTCLRLPQLWKTYAAVLGV